MERATAPARSLAIVHLDIDRFKSVNESMGYAAGGQADRPRDRPAGGGHGAGRHARRIAGDEFLVIASPGQPADAPAVAGRLVRGA